MPWNHLNLTEANAFAKAHGPQELRDEITRMQRLVKGPKLSPTRRALTVEIFEKHQMLEKLLEGSCGKGKSHFKYDSSPAVIRNIINTVYRPLSRGWKKKHP
jgi:hypothetical protein